MLVTEAQQPCTAGDWTQRFGNSIRRPCSTSWITLFDRSGERPMISLAAATPMATMAVVLASRVTTHLSGCLQPSDALLDTTDATEQLTAISAHVFTDSR